MPIQARTEFAAALNQIASEKGVDTDVVLSAIESAALAAYRKDLTLRGEEVPEDFEELTAKIDPVTGEISILRGTKNITPPGFARIAAQTAKQVIMQRLYEAEKFAIMDEYEKKVGTVISGVVQRQEGSSYYIDLGRAEGVMPIMEQTRDEYYHSGQRLKFLIKEIREGRRGPEVILSRADPDLVKGLFGLEVPEIQAGTVVVKTVAREAGGRCKIAAVSTQEGVDPVGSLVGQKGVRVQAVMQELGEEKIDIISYSEDQSRFVAAALSPAKDVVVNLEEVNGEKIAKVKVPDSQLSLAIGKGGQNVRLAAKLTGIKIDIEGNGDGSVRPERPGFKPEFGLVDDTPKKKSKAPILVEEAGTSEIKEDLPAGRQGTVSDQPTDDTTAPVDLSAAESVEKIQESVEANIEAAADEEGAELPKEPTTEETKEAFATAETDMAQSEDLLKADSTGGDLIANEEVDSTGEPKDVADKNEK